MKRFASMEVSIPYLFVIILNQIASIRALNVKGFLNNIFAVEFISRSSMYVTQISFIYSYQN